ncbi:MAG: hypothetical protein ABJB09_02930 [Verrucomicrobiota bacterium]
MPRKPKIEPAPADGTAAPAPKTASASAKPKRKRSAPKKKPAAAGDSVSAKMPASPPATEPTDEEVRLRAYFLAERRLRMSLPGDSDHDWIEARRQLIAESGHAPGS